VGGLAVTIDTKGGNMNLFITKPAARHQETDEVDDSLHYLPHEEEPTDFYQKYKDDDYLPREGRSNLRNFFDNIDVKDYYWLSMAKKQLRKK
jgi:hypothetical protein